MIPIQYSYTMINKIFISIAFFTCLFALFSCHKSESIKVKVKFYNKTGHELKNLKIGDKRIGDLGYDKQTKYIQYAGFVFDTGMPDEEISGKIDHEKIYDYSDFYWCGTEKYIVTEGTYEIEIHKVDYDNKVYLRLDLK